MIKLQLSHVPSPIGELLLVSQRDALGALDYADCEQRMLTLLKRRYGAFCLTKDGGYSQYKAQLQSYFAGSYAALDTIPIAPRGTPFQQRVWNALRSLPSGTVMTYSELATNLGNPQGARAVGLANALNPIAIVIPCHRLVGANGSLTGYAGGLERKRWLLKHEGVEL